MPSGVYQRKLKETVCVICNTIFLSMGGKGKYCNKHKFIFCKCGKKIKRRTITGKCERCFQTTKIISKKTRLKISKKLKNKIKNHKIDCKCCSCRAKRGEYKGKKSYFYNVRLYGKNNPNFNFNKSKYNIYKEKCKFVFSFKDYPNEFDFLKIKYMFNPLKYKEGYIYVRDHILSVFDGFKYNINPKYLKHPTNCKIISLFENSKKNKLSLINKKELLKKIRIWNKKYPRHYQASRKYKKLIK